MILQNKNALVKTMQNVICFSRGEVVFSWDKLELVCMLQRVYSQGLYVLFFNLD